MENLDFRYIANALPVALYTTDADGLINYYNSAAAELWGREPKLGEEYWCGSLRLFWPDGRPMAHDECPMAMALKSAQQVTGIEAVAERPDGTRYLFVPHPTPLFDQEGRLNGAVNMLLDVTAWRSAEEGAHRLAAIVESSDDAIISKKLDGTITSWNGAAQRLFGYTAEEIVGRSVLVLIPDDRQAEEELIVGRIRNGERIEHFETIRRHKNGDLVDISLTVSPIKRADGLIVGASKIARDIGERRRADAQLLRQNERLETLNRVSGIISRDLDLGRIVQAVTDEATKLSGAEFGAFFYNIKNPDGETYRLYTLTGNRDENFENFEVPPYVDIFAQTFETKKIIRSDDIRLEMELQQSMRHGGICGEDLPVVSYVAAPVILSSGEVMGGLFFGHREPAMFSLETDNLISAIAGQAAIAMDNARLHEAAKLEIVHRKNAEAAKELLLHEIKHRVKNTLATIQALASQTLHNSPREERRAFIERLHSLSRAHDLLTQEDWDEVGLIDVADATLKPFVQNEDRLIAEGPDVKLSANKALLLTMILHELGTNAVKYGAFSGNDGKVDLGWDIEDCASRPLLRMRWRESGGPTVLPPARQGFGSRMIESALHGEQGDVHFNFAPSGLEVELQIVV